MQPPVRDLSDPVLKHQCGQFKIGFEPALSQETTCRGAVTCSHQVLFKELEPSGLAQMQACRATARLPSSGVRPAACGIPSMTVIAGARAMAYLCAVTAPMSWNTPAVLVTATTKQRETGTTSLAMTWNAISAGTSAKELREGLHNETAKLCKSFHSLSLPPGFGAEPGGFCGPPHILPRIIRKSGSVKALCIS